MSVESNSGVYRGLEVDVEMFGEHDLIVGNEYNAVIHVKNEDDGVTAYSEYHLIEDGSIDSLAPRVRKIVDRIQEDDSLRICNGCGVVYDESNSRVTELSLRDLLTGTLVKHRPFREAHTCLYTSGRFLKTVHLVTHPKENPVFDESELLECDSLVYAMAQV